MEKLDELVTCCHCKRPRLPVDIRPTKYMGEDDSPVCRGCYGELTALLPPDHPFFDPYK